MKAWEIWGYVDRADLKNQRSRVTPDRRRAIIQTMIRSNDWIA